MSEYVQVHRFHDKVAINVGNEGQTIYFTVEEAAKLARAISLCALDTATKGFVESAFQSVEFEVRGTK